MKTHHPKLPISFPESWAECFGQDEHGLWCGIYVGDIEVRFRWIPPGEFQMGSPEDEPERYADEGPQHRVGFEQGFWLAQTACTQALWQAVMDENPSRFKGDPQNPVEHVRWEQAQVFIKALNQQAPLPALRLPSEAQWEYACRAGTTTPFWFGTELTTGDANYDGNHPYADGKQGQYREKTLPVKHFRPNPWGLYQMHGNVWEWCEDRWHDSYQGASDDGQPWTAGNSAFRVLRGGSWLDDGRYVRSAIRSRFLPDDRDSYFGFRFALGPELQPVRQGRG